MEAIMNHRISESYRREYDIIAEPIQDISMLVQQIEKDITHWMNTIINRQFINQNIYHNNHEYYVPDFQNASLSTTASIIVRYLSSISEYNEYWFYGEIESCISLLLSKYSENQLLTAIPYLPLRIPTHRERSRSSSQVSIDNFTYFRDSEQEAPRHIQIEMKAFEQSCIHSTECPICYEWFDTNELIRTKCNHLFCRSCIFATIDSVNIDQCPRCAMCREEMKILYTYIDEHFHALTERYGK